MMKSVITCDLEGVIETINPDGEKLFGYPKEELIGKKRVSLFSAGEIVIQNVGTWLKGATKDGEHTTKTFFIRKDGSRFNAKIKITPTFANGKATPKRVIVVSQLQLMKKLKFRLNFQPNLSNGFLRLQGEDLPVLHYFQYLL